MMAQLVLKIHNVGGFTEWIEGALLGNAEETCILIHPQNHCAIPGEVKQVRLESIQENQSHRTRLMRLIAVPNLPESDKTL